VLVSVARTRRRRERRDTSALRAIVVKRALTRAQLPPGHVYVLPGHEDDPYRVHRVAARCVVLKCGSGGYLIFEHPHRPVTAWWYPTPPPRRTRAEIAAAITAAGYPALDTQPVPMRGGLT
jgi:hypothetical protein